MTGSKTRLLAALALCGAATFAQAQAPIVGRLRDGLAKAEAAVDDGRALAKLDAWVAASQELAAR